MTARPELLDWECLEPQWLLVMKTEDLVPSRPSPGRTDVQDCRAQSHPQDFRRSAFLLLLLCGLLPCGLLCGLHCGCVCSLNRCRAGDREEAWEERLRPGPRSCPQLS